MEACRPKTREQCVIDFIMFLSISIPQKFKVNADNFSKNFYEPIMQSFHDLDHLSAQFVKDSYVRSQNRSTVPVESFSTREKSGLLQVWILSLGIQEESNLQFYSIPFHFLDVTSYSGSKHCSQPSSTFDTD